MDLEASTIRKATLRLVPFLILCYFVAFLDRVNVGFAALTMNKDLGLTQTMFALGSGIFFLSYFLFEVPSNLFLERFGARKWIARIMFTWGILSGAMAFIGGEYSFYAVRFLLGIAEAGFFPGIIFYLTLWFPAVYRARIVGGFMVAIPLSSVLGSPVSGYILGLDGVAGLHGWQWLYLIEAAPAVLLSVVVFFYLTDRPADATWLSTPQREWLAARLAAETTQRERAETLTVRQALLDRRVLALSLVYFGVVACLYGVQFFLPQIVKAFGLTNVQTGFVTAIPYVIGSFAVVYWGRRSDRTGERKGHVVFALAVAAGGILAAAFISDPTFKMLCLTVSAFGVFGALPVFWTLPTAFLSGAAAAGGIAVINSVGNLSGFAGPYLMGAIKDRTGSFDGGLMCLAAFGFTAMLIVLALRHDGTLEKAPVAAPAE